MTDTLLGYISLMTHKYSLYKHTEGTCFNVSQYKQGNSQGKLVFQCSSLGKTLYYTSNYNVFLAVKR